MKKFILLLLVVFTFTTFASCRREPSAQDLLSKFVDVYGAEGVIYSPKISEGNEGYIPDGLIERIYIFSGNFPDNYAIFLNSRTTDFSECGVFVCDDGESLLSVEEMCLERIKLLCGGEGRGFVRISGMTVFYSTMQERERAEKIWREIIR